MSHATVAELVRLGFAPRDRFRVIPLGLDLDPFANLDPRPGGSLRDELNVAEDVVLVTYVGRVVPIKRLDVLLRGRVRRKGRWSAPPTRRGRRWRAAAGSRAALQ